MEPILDFFRKLFDTSDWPPRWHCGNWTEFHGWLYIISDLLIWSAYFAIPLTILRYITRRAGAKFVKAYFLFAGFILACGSTHLLDAVTFWYPAYRLNALVRFITGVVSWVTVFHIIKILPVATSLRTHAELEKEIGERKKVEEELKIANSQLNIAQEIVRIGHWEWDVPANKIVWSRELYKIYEAAPGVELSYEKYLAHIHPDDREFVNNVIQQNLQNKRFAGFTHRLKGSNGTEKIIQSRGEVMTNAAGDIVKMIGTAQDITDQQKAQQQLMERTQELEASNAELQKFAHVASHDLQEPLRKIMTFASLLQKEADTAANERWQMYTEKMVRSSGRMQQLIDDILQFSSLRVTNASFKPTALNNIIGEVLNDMEVAIEKGGATIHAGPLPTIEAIPSQIGQLFQNLISNAVKFRRDNIPVHISITGSLLSTDEVKGYGWIGEGGGSLPDYRYNRTGEQFIKITVQDNGIGFDEAYSKKIFEIFQRLHAASTYGGTGIGLAICKKIVDNHHGLITATGKEGEGAVFTIILPLAQKSFMGEEKA